MAMDEYERARLLLDSTPLACRLWNKDFQIFELNDEAVRLFGAKNKQEIIDNYFDLSPEYQPDGQISYDKAIAMLTRTLAVGKCVLEWTHKTKDGTLFPTEITLIRVAYGDEYVVAGYTRDLREQKKMLDEIESRDRQLQEAYEQTKLLLDRIQDTSAQLETAMTDAVRANHAKSEFLARMSHEMRTPLNAVIGLSELSLNAGRLDEDDESNIEKIYNAGLTLLSTVNDILDLSKIEAGRLELVETDYDVPSMINDTVVQNMMRLGEKPLKLILDLDEYVFARIHGDELRIRQIMNNLLSNAIKYTQEGEVILRVQCAMDGDAIWVTIQVSDTGKGIKAEDLDGLFSDYAQIDQESNHMIEGTGLGLPITKKLAELMNGSVHVESVYGEGSVFTVTVAQGYVDDTRIGPEVAESLKAFHYADRKRDHHARLNRIRLPYARVLVVDDNITNLDVAKGLMKPYGMKIDCVTGGQQAVDAVRLEAVRYNAIFMDYMMPEMDGLEATQLIRAIPSDYARQVPIIALTANAIAGNEEMMLNNGFQAFLSKPIDISRLDEVIRGWVRDKEQEQLIADQVEDLKGAQSRRFVTDRRSGIDRRTANMELAGLDIEKGIERFGGDEDTYLGVLRSFAVNTRPLLEQIGDVHEASLEEYAIIVHGIKGSSRGVLAEMIGASAENLEKAAKAGDYDYVKKHNQTFCDATWKLIHDLEEMFSKFNGDSPKPSMDKPDSALLARLLAACETHDLGAVDELMAEIGQYAYEKDDGLTEWLQGKADSMAFGEIVARLTASATEA